MPRVILGPRRMPPAASCSWRQEAGRIVGRVPSRGGPAESWRAVALFPFSSPFHRSFCMSVYQSSCNMHHIFRDCNVFRKIFLPPQHFRCAMRLDGSHPSRTIPRMKTQPRIGPRRLFEERRKDRFKKSGWTTFLLLTLSSNTVAMLGTDPYGDSRPLSQLQLRQNYSLTPDSLAAGRWPVVTSKRFLGGGRSGASAPPARPTGCLKTHYVHARSTTLAVGLPNAWPTRLKRKIATPCVVLLIPLPKQLAQRQ